METMLEKAPTVRRWTLLVLIAGVPLIFLRTENDPFNVPKLALLVVCTTIALGVRVAEAIAGAPSQGLRRLWIPSAAIGVPLFIAWAFSPYKSFAIWGEYARFQGLLPYLLVIIAGVLIADAFAGRTREVAWALLAAGAVMGAYSILQVAGADPYDWALEGSTTTSAISTVGNSNFTGGFLGMILPVAVSLWVVELRLRHRIWKLGALVAAGWILSFSEGGWMAGLAGLALVGGTIFSVRWARSRVVGGVLAGGIAAAVVGIVIAGIVMSDSSAIPQAARVRGGWWKAAAGMAAESPIVGRGPNTFFLEGIQHRTARDAAELGFDFTDDPHSVPFAFLTGAGALGVIGLAIAVAWVVGTGVGIPQENVLASGFLAASIAYLVQALISIDELTLRLGFWISIGTLAAALAPVPKQVPVGGRRGKKKKKSSSKARRAPRPVVAPGRALPALLAGVLLGGSGVVWSVRLLVADHDVVAARTLFASDRPDEGREKFESALRFRDDVRLRSIYAFNLGNAALMNQDERFFEDAKRVYAEVTRYPLPGAYRDLGRFLYEWAGLHDGDPAVETQSYEAYITGVEIDPRNPVLRAEATDPMLRLGKEKEALELLRPAIDALALLRPDFVLGPPHAEVWGALAQARFLDGDVAGAKEAVLRAQAIDYNEERAKRAEEALAKLPSN
jgi:hypothetical protein